MTWITLSPFCPTSPCNPGGPGGPGAPFVTSHSSSKIIMQCHSELNNEWNNTSLFTHCAICFALTNKTMKSWYQNLTFVFIMFLLISPGGPGGPGCPSVPLGPCKDSPSAPLSPFLPISPGKPGAPGGPSIYLPAVNHDHKGKNYYCKLLQNANLILSKGFSLTWRTRNSWLSAITWWM